MGKGKFTLGDRDKRLLIIVIGIVLVVLVYLFVFRQGTNKAAEIEEENAELQNEVTTLEGMVAQEAAVEEETAQVKQLQQDIVAKYPADVTQETATAFIQDLEDNYDFDVSQITYVMNNEVSVDLTAYQEAAAEDTQEETGDDTSSDEEQEEETTTPVVIVPSVSGGYTSVTLNFTATYSALKQVVEEINFYRDRMTIPAISASYDSETGDLSGSMNIYMYYMTGTERSYLPPDIEYTESGVKNIFGSGE